MIFKSKQKIIVTNTRVIFTTGSETDTVKRSFDFKEIAGISKKTAKESRSLVIHVFGTADEFFHTEKRDDIVDVIKRIYAEKMKLNLPVFSPAEK